MGVFHFKITINDLIALPASYEYLCYGYTAIRNILIFHGGDRGSIYRRRILTTMDVRFWSLQYVRVWVYSTSDSEFIVRQILSL